MKYLYFGMKMYSIFFYYLIQRVNEVITQRTPKIKGLLKMFKRKTKMVQSSKLFMLEVLDFYQNVFVLFTHTHIWYNVLCAENPTRDITDLNTYCIFFCDVIKIFFPQILVKTNS